MATYKLIQDIEAEDKILGPLTLRQFIFAILAVFFFYICFILVNKHVAWLLAIFLPPALFFGFFAMPFGRDQPTEIWALAKLRYYFKPRKRVWNQSGVKELVTITVPKKIERVVTNGLSQTEVRSRLRALANTLDSRGWAVKNIDINAYTPAITGGSSERLLDLDAIPQPVPDTDITPADDILDAGASPLAQQFDNMIDRSTQTHRQELIERLNRERSGQKSDDWFMNQSANSGGAAPTPARPAPASPLPTDDDTVGEAELAARLRAKRGGPQEAGHMRSLQPSGGLPVAPAAPPSAAAGPPSDPAIVALANNDDLNVSTLAREAQRAKGEDEPGEVVIPLH